MVWAASPSSESDILSRLVVPDGPPPPAEFARWLLGVRFTAEAEDQIRDLLGKNSRGILGADERSLLDKYLSIGRLLDVLQASARGAELCGRFGVDDESSQSAAISQAGSPSRFEAFQRIVEITAEVFGQEPRVKHDSNPEFPGERYIVLAVEAPLDRKSILDLEAEWTRKVACVEPKLDALRLSIRPRK